MTVYVQVVNTAIGLLLQQECTKVGHLSIVKKMLTTAICFGVMVLIQTSANLAVLKEMERYVI
jgi:hypothetical protein